LFLDDDDHDDGGGDYLTWREHKFVATLVQNCDVSGQQMFVAILSTAMLLKGSNYLACAGRVGNEVSAEGDGSGCLLGCVNRLAVVCLQCLPAQWPRICL